MRVSSHILWGEWAETTCRHRPHPYPSCPALSRPAITSPWRPGHLASPCGRQTTAAAMRALHKCSSIPHPFAVALYNSRLHSSYLHNTSTTSNRTSSSRRTRHLRHRPDDSNTGSSSNDNSNNTISNNTNASKSKSTSSNTTGNSCSTTSDLLVVILVDVVIPSYVQIRYTELFTGASGTESPGTVTWNTQHEMMFFSGLRSLRTGLIQKNASLAANADT